jgi:hypothetical protein
LLAALAMTGWSKESPDMTDIRPGPLLAMEHGTAEDWQ